MMDLNDDYAETERLQAMFAKGTSETMGLQRENNKMLGGQTDVL